MSNVQDIVKVEPKLTKEELVSADLEIKKLEAKRLELEILEKEANLQDIRERLAERELGRESRRQRSLGNGAILKQIEASEKAHQRRCNHRKGGNGAEGVIGGQGDDTQHAVLKHVFANGDMWVRCLRCGKTWKPPIKDEYANEESYLKAVAEYHAATQFQTRNVTSKAVIFGFSDNGQYYRDVTRNTTLR